MKTLTLLRHAKSSWDDPSMRDFDRPLNRRGRAAARTMGREMRALGLDFDAVVASPAMRVMETVEGLSEGYGNRLHPDYDRRIYLASVETLLEIVRGTDDAHARLLLLGHNPGFELLALALVIADGAEARGKLAEKYPTGALAEIELPVAQWRDAGPGTGTLSRFIRPRDLDPKLGPETD
ncbi:histidine phosphatase family protein [Sphingosinicella sp. LHD-64]|uniref:SixA phosphatase family protein n=1 Tax=Sphingosinicella sp. LHD-64 TaxID=3072139 RepID=UPI0028105FB8|nr:histidine phosphatase family protein [Sphingosinicella sp. LHD-64]MDQ8756870.1 histidine phosphatase family protein [Sphingosinicella sp. LHD-64]